MPKIVAVHSDGGRMKTLEHTPVAAVEVDDIVVVGTRVCVAYADIAAGAEGQLIYQADEVEVEKAAVAITEGEIAYWDGAASKFTNVDGAGANKKCGMWRKAALLGDTNGVIELNNTP